jgi:hypothetical protein
LDILIGFDVVIDISSVLTVTPPIVCNAENEEKSSSKSIVESTRMIHEIPRSAL